MFFTAFTLFGPNLRPSLVMTCPMNLTCCLFRIIFLLVSLRFTFLALSNSFLRYFRHGWSQLPLVCLHILQQGSHFLECPIVQAWYLFMKSVFQFYGSKADTKWHSDISLSAKWSPGGCFVAFIQPDLVKTILSVGGCKYFSFAESRQYILKSWHLTWIPVDFPTRRHTRMVFPKR